MAYEASKGKRSPVGRQVKLFLLWRETEVTTGQLKRPWPFAWNQLQKHKEKVKHARHDRN